MLTVPNVKLSTVAGSLLLPTAEQRVKGSLPRVQVVEFLGNLVFVRVLAGLQLPGQLVDDRDLRRVLVNFVLVTCETKKKRDYETHWCLRDNNANSNGQNCRNIVKNEWQKSNPDFGK